MAQAAEGKPRHIPAGSGSANNGSNLGVSVLNSNNVLSNANPNYGSALAYNIPIIAIMTKVVSWEMATRRLQQHKPPFSEVLLPSPAERQTYPYGRGSPH